MVGFLTEFPSWIMKMSLKLVNMLCNLMVFSLIWIEWPKNLSSFPELGYKILLPNGPKFMFFSNILLKFWREFLKSKNKLSQVFWNKLMKKAFSESKIKIYVKCVGNIRINNSLRRIRGKPHVVFLHEFGIHLKSNFGSIRCFFVLQCQSMA